MNNFVTVSGGRQRDSAILYACIHPPPNAPPIWNCQISLYSSNNDSYHTSVQSLSRVWLFATPWIAARQASPSITNSQSLLKLILPHLSL